MADERKEHDDGDSNLEITTPLGKIISKGKRNAELVALLSLLALSLISWVLWQHHEESSRSRAENNANMNMLAAAIKDFASAQREMACIIALPQDRREEEYRSPLSFCRRLGSMP